MPDVIERLIAFAEAGRASLPPEAGRRPVAHGWATVDMERVLEELGDALGIPSQRFAVARDTELLGARCRVADAALPDGSSLAVLEPITEGRLAATLARVGEGPAAIWLAAADDRLSGIPSGDALATSSQRDGPFGVERLVLGGPIHGPHRLLVGPPVTIRA